VVSAANRFSLRNYVLPVKQFLLSNCGANNELVFAAELHVASESIFIVEFCVLANRSSLCRQRTSFANDSVVQRISSLMTLRN